MVQANQVATHRNLELEVRYRQESGLLITNNEHFEKHL